jgi:hypothetical protein
MYVVNVCLHVILALREKHYHISVSSIYQFLLKDCATRENMFFFAHYPNSCMGQIKLNTLGLQTKALIAGLIQMDSLVKTFNKF